MARCTAARVVGCALGFAVGCHPVPEPAPPGVERLAAPGFSSQPLAPFPSAESCALDDTVARDDVRWRLRTRLDAPATLQIAEGRVTARLLAGARPMAVARVEHAGVTIQGLVAPADLTVALARPELVSDFVVPTGPRACRVLAVAADRARLDVSVGRQLRVAFELGCADLGLKAPRWAELEGRGAQIYVDGSETIRTAFGIGLRVADLAHDDVSGVVRAIDLTPEAEAAQHIVALPNCGASLVVSVHASAFRPLPHPERIRAPRVCAASAPADRGDVDPAALVSCPRPVALFIRSESYEDEIGVLAPGARLRIDGGARGATTLVTLPDAPAGPIPPARFSARTADLTGCSG